MERIITYTISTGESGENVLGFLRKKGFSKHILTTMKAGGAGDPAERAAGFWQNGPEGGGCSPDPCSGRDRGRIGVFHYSGAAASGYPV